MVRKLIQYIAFFLPSPFNIWVHRLSGAKIGKNVVIHPFVLIRAREIKIGDGAKVKLGTMMNLRSFHLGRKSSIGYFTLVRGESDLHIGDACLVGVRTIIQCSEAVNFSHYSGVGPNSVLVTHGSFLPVTEGYPAKFGPITLRSRTWLCMNTTVGPGVTVGENCIVLPGSVLSRDVSPNTLVSGAQVSLKTVAISAILKKPDDMKFFTEGLLKNFCEWLVEYRNTDCEVAQNFVKVCFRRRDYVISINDDNADIVLYTESGMRRHRMFFNLADLTTDAYRHPLKVEIEDFMRLQYGLTFL